jgi:multiple sugar transport system substrate-binding protein
MWEWMRGAWALANPQSTGYAFMQEPLQSGEVWVAWDHQARLIDALKASPDDFVAFPAPPAPQGAGVHPGPRRPGDPQDRPRRGRRQGPDPLPHRPQADRHRRPRARLLPPTAQQQLPAELNPGIKAEADAIQAQSTSQDKITSLLPVGLKDKGGAYDDVFRTTFTGIVLRRRDTKQTLAGKAKELQGCWTR